MHVKVLLPHLVISIMTPTVEHEKGFGVILEATAELIVEALKSSPYSAVASAAVLQSTLLIEAAANCCIYDLHLDSKLSKELDRLPSLTKLDLFLLIRTGGKKAIDRGASLYQDVQELKNIRDRTVHPKTSRIMWTQVDADNAFGKHDKTPRLGINLTNLSWSVDDAIKAFKAANRFLDNFFTELCSMNRKEVRILLLAPIGDDAVEDIFLSTEQLKNLQKNHDIPLSYVEVGIYE